VGIGKHVGHAMTFKILTKDDKVKHRSIVRSATGTVAFVNQKATAAAEQPRHDPTTEKSPEDTFQSELQEDIIIPIIYCKLTLKGLFSVVSQHLQ
jgi:hypothetical protein